MMFDRHIDFQKQLGLCTFSKILQIMVHFTFPLNHFHKIKCGYDERKHLNSYEKRVS